ncbi:MAG: MATE family efflux transporter [Oscillospiraceae bacterium]|nr:MATE family efflux transporter [Oscillospiraceae bacterium]
MEEKETALQENKMGVMPIGKLLAGMAIPMMVSMLVQAFYNVVDSIFVARISENALTAVSLAFPLQNLMIAVGGGTAVGMNAVLSRSLGEKRQELVDRSANTGIFLFLISAIAFAFIGAFLSRPFFGTQTDVAEIVEYGTVYSQICLVGSAGIFSQFCFERLLQSTGKTTLAMITQLIGAVINIILDPILIFGLLGAPRLEVAGAALATIIGQIVAAVIAIIINIKVNHEIHLSIRKIRWDTEVARRIYTVGFPSILMQSVGSVMNYFLNRILLSFTTTATAVFGAYFKLQSFIFMPVFGLNNGMVPIIAYNYGAKRPDRVKKTIKLSLMSAISIMAVGVVLFETIPEVLLGFFNASPEMLQIGVPALRIIAINFLLAGFCIISISVFQAIGNPIHSFIISVCRQLLVLLPAAWLLARTGVLNLVWLAFPIAEMVSVIMCLTILKGTLKKVDVLTEQQ